MIKQGKVWTPEQNDGKPYATEKIKSTASTLCSYPSHAQARAVTYDSHHGHVAVSNNLGDITILNYADLKPITTLLKPREWAEVLAYSPNHEYLAVGAHDDSVYVYKISEGGEYTLYWAITSRHSSAITGMDWTKDSKHIRAID